jgi:hypothetical protein
MSGSDLNCLRETRRDLVRASNLNGVDYIDVHGKHLCVHFLNEVPAESELSAANIVIRGGRQITGLTIKEPLMRDETDDEYGESCLGINLDREGDLSTYSLCFVEIDNDGPTGRPLHTFDPRYACAEFHFRMDCPAEVDCNRDEACAIDPGVRPEINYLAKDYATFRQLILDRLALVMPQWTERHVPDVGIALVEILAYAGDYLSYYQDSVGTEQYIATARQRISVRRHARLVDYAMHEGCNARAFLALEVREDAKLEAADVFFVTSWRDAQPITLHQSDLPVTVPASFIVYEPLVETTEIELHAAHNRIEIYTWGDVECCLPNGSTHATLVDTYIIPEVPKEPSYDQHGNECPPDPPDPATLSRKLALEAGDFLLLEELACATTATNGILANGAAAPDADRTHRQVVRLTRVEAAVDPLTAQPVVEVEWALEDALPFPLCVSAIGRAPECELVRNLSIARGNVILADHGATVVDEPLPIVPEDPMPPVCEEVEMLSEISRIAARYRPALRGAPLTFAQALIAHAPAARLAIQDPRAALPQVRLAAIPAAAARPASLFEPGDLTDARPLAARFVHAGDPSVRAMVNHLSGGTRALLDDWSPDTALPDALLAGLAADLGSEINPKDPAKAMNTARAVFDATDSSLINLRYRLSPELIALLAAQKGDEIPAGLANAISADLRRLLTNWTPSADLLASDSVDNDFVAEIDDGGRAHLRFGDGELGASLDVGMTFLATYRTGNGRAGLIGPEALDHIVFRAGFNDAVTRVRNPLPSRGAFDPELVEEVKMFAPVNFRKDLQRAIVSEDYALLAQYLRYPQRNPRVQSAAAQLQWSGSWYEAAIAVDPLHAFQSPVDLLTSIDGSMHRYRRMGHDLRVSDAQLVPLRLSMSVCVKSDYQQGHVYRALLDSFSSRVLRDGRLGFFHPDNLTFGDAIRISRIIAVAQAVDGVAEVHVTTLERQFDGANPDFDDGLLRLGATEIARLDNDAAYPENGVLEIEMRGGR